METLGKIKLMISFDHFSDQERLMLVEIFGICIQGEGALHGLLLGPDLEGSNETLGVLLDLELVGRGVGHGQVLQGLQQVFALVQPDHVLQDHAGRLHQEHVVVSLEGLVDVLLVHYKGDVSMLREAKPSQCLSALIKSLLPLPARKSLLG